MADVTPQTSPQDAWNENQYRVEGLVAEKLRRTSGREGFKKHFWAVMEEVKDYFFSTFTFTFSRPERVYEMPDLVHYLPEQTFWRKYLVHYWEPEQTFWRKISIPEIVDVVVEGFVMEERRRLWFAHRAKVISNLQKALPACARQFEADYTEFFLLKFVFRKFDAGSPEGRWADELEEWLEQLVKKVVTTEIPKLINDKGELIDEELVRLADTYEAARVQLMDRYSPKIKKIVAGIVYKHHLCPPSQDAPSFIEDAAQNVCHKIIAKLESYRFEQPFEHWVAKICTNEALLGQRDDVGRGPPRVFVTWEEFLQQAPSPVIRDTEHRDILKKVIDKYKEQGRRAKKSWDAIRLKWFEDLDVEEIAVRLNTTEGYVYKMFSHDYPKLRGISIDDFGFSGTDL